MSSAMLIYYAAAGFPPWTIGAPWVILRRICGDCILTLLTANWTGVMLPLFRGVNPPIWLKADNLLLLLVPLLVYPVLLATSEIYEWKEF